ncbi:hypothetical protein [Ferribacterium limneticum]|uniref:hypothetical protein n=1 Tax=Ferribacterium limneticum TaxID=76259 RepID=UPI001CF84091|nr:hypothetical protein [Ferribacterium limneticum]UCV23464.1 hypothetical protein KI613_02660 [Ferribacterium limneticum]
MNIAPLPSSRPPAANPGQQAAANSPPGVDSGQPAAANPPRANAEPELAVVAVLGYN